MNKEKFPFKLKRINIDNKTFKDNFISILETNSLWTSNIFLKVTYEVEFLLLYAGYFN